MYHGPSWADALSSSMLADIADSSVAHAIYLAKRGEDTQSLRVGRAAHCLALRPSEFDREFVVGPVCDRRTKDGKEAWARFVEQAGSREILTEGEWQEAKSAADAVARSETATQLLDLCPSRELSVVARYEGVLCKVRVDAYSREHGVMVDLKTTSGHATPREFQRDLASYRYAMRALFYQEVCRAAGLAVEHVCFIVAEKSRWVESDGRLDRLTGARVMRIGEMSLESERSRMLACIRAYAEFRGGNGVAVRNPYPEGVAVVELPGWYLNREDGEA